MAGVLATQMATLRTALAAAPASLSNLSENFSIEEPPNTDRTYFVVVLEPSASQQNAIHGGGSLNEYERVIAVKLAHFRDVDQETFGDSVADDLENVDDVMLNDANKTSGVVIVTKESESSEDRGSWLRTDLRYRVRFRKARA